MDEIFNVIDGYNALKKAGHKVYFNAAHLGNIVTIEVRVIEKSNTVDSIHIYGVNADDEDEHIDNWCEEALFMRQKLEVLSGKWFIF